MKATRIPVVERLFAKLEQKPNGCIEFVGHRSRHGYGRINRDGGRDIARAHRLAWELTHGPIPDGMCVCHSCDNPPCCNPDHLFLGTQRANVRDMVLKGRHGNLAKTACVKGHPFDAENTALEPNGKRYCRACKRVASRDSMRRMREGRRLQLAEGN